MNKLKGIPKLDDANWAGTKKSDQCTLILTEGDSAKTMAISGLSVIGRDKYGIFPLRGKVLNVKEASIKQITDNIEITHLKKIIGLEKQLSSYRAKQRLVFAQLLERHDLDENLDADTAALVASLIGRKKRTKRRRKSKSKSKKTKSNRRRRRRN